MLSRLLHIIRSTILILILMLATNCTEIIDLDLNTETERLVVDAILSNEDRQFVVKLSRSVPYFTTEAAPPVNHAFIEIINERTNQRLVLKEDSLLTGRYSAKAAQEMLVPGDSLKLVIKEVNINGNTSLENYTARAIVPAVVELDSIQIRYNSSRVTWQILAYFQDPLKIENFYLFKVVVNDYIITQRPDDIRISSDQLYNGSYVNGVWVHSIDASNNNSQFADGNIIALQLISVTEEYYNFFYALHQEIYESAPLFTGPAANVPGNISGNALGIFAVTAISKRGIIFDSKIHNQ